MNELEIFKNEEFGEVRTVSIDNEPWFVAKDVAEILGYAKPRNAVSSHVDFDDKKDAPIQGDLGGTQKMTIINESGLYSLIISSKLPDAKKFKRWITSEVLPSIRKHGAYMTEETLEKALTSPDFLIQLATQLKEEQTARKLAEQKIEEQKPLVDFANHVTSSSDSVDVGEFSKIVKNEHINIGRNRLSQWLRDCKYLMSNNVPYQKYIDNGYFDVTETTKDTSYGTKIFSKTLIKGKGQVVLVEKLRKEFA